MSDLDIAIAAMVVIRGEMQNLECKSATLEKEFHTLLETIEGMKHDHTDQCMALIKERDALAEKCKKYEAALEHIAAFMTNDFGQFQAQLARKALGGGE